jgi:DNA-directed RNA polymerase subunit RPC12/RpoP
MSILESGLTPYTCPDCGKIYHALKGSRVLCPKYHKWIKPDDTGEPEPTRAKPYHNCQRCGKVFRANSNREKYCKDCKPFMVRESTRNRVQKFRSKIVPCNVLDTI